MDYLQFSVMKAGEVTAALHQLYEGDQIGVRAPLGNYFPYESMKGKNILFIGGGIGLAPLRTLILYMLDNRADYKDITIIYGSRTPPDLCYKDDLKEWEERSDVNLILTVDAEFPGWDKRVGFVVLFGRILDANQVDLLKIFFRRDLIQEGLLFFLAFSPRDNQR